MAQTKKTRSTASSKSGGRAAGKESPARPKPAARTNAKTSPQRKKTRNKGPGVLDKAKDVMENVLAGAAVGAVKGAAEAVLPEIEKAAKTREPRTGTKKKGVKRTQN